MSRRSSHLRTSPLKTAPPPPPDAAVIDLTAPDSEDEVEEHLLVEHPQPPRMRNPGKRDGLHAASAWTTYHHDAGPAVSVNAVYQCSHPWKASPACEHIYPSSKVGICTTFPLSRVANQPVFIPAAERTLFGGAPNGRRVVAVVAVTTHIQDLAKRMFLRHQGHSTCHFHERNPLQCCRACTVQGRCVSLAMNKEESLLTVLLPERHGSRIPARSLCISSLAHNVSAVHQTRSSYASGCQSASRHALQSVVFLLDIRW
jgi:hypothetical protein